MKNLELKDLGVQELNTKEMSTIEGGGLLGDIFGVVGAVSTTLNGVVNTVNTVVGNTVKFGLAQLFTILGSL